MEVGPEAIQIGAGREGAGILAEGEEEAADEEAAVAEVGEATDEAEVAAMRIARRSSVTNAKNQGTSPTSVLKGELSNSSRISPSTASSGTQITRTLWRILVT